MVSLLQALVIANVLLKLGNKHFPTMLWLTINILEYCIFCFRSWSHGIYLKSILSSINGVNRTQNLIKDIFFEPYLVIAGRDVGLKKCM